MKLLMLSPYFFFFEMLHSSHSRLVFSFNVF